MKKVLVVLLLALAMFAPVFANAANETKAVTVRYGIHPNGSATSAAFIADDLGYAEKYDLKLERQVMTGPNVWAALNSGDLDIGFLGNGMAWHYFSSDSPIYILTLDNLTDDDRLVMRDNVGFKGYDSLDDIYRLLPGKKIALDLTATPVTFLCSLVDTINEGKKDADKLWFNNGVDDYPLKGSANKEIKVVGTTNANITAVMEDTSIDGCVAFGNPKAKLVSSGKYVVAATTFTHLSDTKITPSTWAVRKEFAEQHPEEVVKFCKFLLEGMDYRADEANYPDITKRAAAFDQCDPNDYDMYAAYWPTAADLKNYYSTSSSDGYRYINQIRTFHVNAGTNITADVALTVDQAFQDKFIKEALGLK